MCVKSLDKKNKNFRYLEKPKYTVISRNTLVKAEIHLENAEIHLKSVQMNLQWIENDEINLKKLYSC